MYRKYARYMQNYFSYKLMSYTIFITNITKSMISIIYIYKIIIIELR